MKAMKFKLIYIKANFALKASKFRQLMQNKLKQQWIYLTLRQAVFICKNLG